MHRLEPPYGTLHRKGFHIWYRVGHETRVLDNLVGLTQKLLESIVCDMGPSL